MNTPSRSNKKNFDLSRDASGPRTVKRQMELSVLSDRQLNAKFAKLLGWKIVNHKWWHDDIGDGPPLNYCKAYGRKWAEAWIVLLESGNKSREEALTSIDQLESGAYP